MAAIQRRRDCDCSWNGDWKEIPRTYRRGSSYVSVAGVKVRRLVQYPTQNSTFHSWSPRYVQIRSHIERIRSSVGNFGISKAKLDKIRSAFRINVAELLARGDDVAAKNGTAGSVHARELLVALLDS